MDIFRLLLCIGVAVLLWRLRIGRREPVREFFLWGVDYPFHFLLTATLVLVVWGVIGARFGLEGLFLVEDPLTQVLLGATVMLLLATITVHYVTLGTSRRGWWTALADVAGFLRGLNAAADRSRPTQTVLVNGFLETLTGADLRCLDRAARAHVEAAEERGAGAPSHQRRDLLEGEAFRLLMAPAILLEKSVGLIVLVGIVPTVVLPILRRDPQACIERLPWLVGTCLGAVLAVVLGCWTTSWASAAAGWDDRKREIRNALAAWRPRGPAAKPEGAQRTPEETAAHASAGEPVDHGTTAAAVCQPCTGPCARRPPGSRGWLRSSSCTPPPRSCSPSGSRRFGSTGPMRPYRAACRPCSRGCRWRSSSVRRSSPA